MAQGHLSALRGTDALKSLVAGNAADLTVARSALHAADGRLASRWLWPIRVVPIAGDNLRSAQAITRTTMAVVDIAFDASQRLSSTQRAALNRSEQLATVADLATRLGAIVDHPQLGPSVMLASPLLRARKQLAEQLDRLRPAVDRANSALPGLRSIAAGPRRFLVVAANNAEMAAGSGLPLAVATVDITQGTPTFGVWKWSGDLPIPGDGATLSPEMQRLWGFASPEGDLRRALVSPRFPTTAPLLAEQYQLATGTSVDGVILIDIVGLQKIVASSTEQIGGTGLSAAQIIP